MTPRVTLRLLTAICALLMAIPITALASSPESGGRLRVHLEKEGWERAMACLDRGDKICAVAACEELVATARWIGEYCLIRVNGDDDDRLELAFEALKADLDPSGSRVTKDLAPIDDLHGKERRAAINAALESQVEMTIWRSDFMRRGEDNNLQNFLTKAEEGDPEAQFQLGNAYLEGSVPGIERDPSSAVQWFSRAAAQAYAPAEYAMGRVYEQGLSVPKDRNQAANWYGKAANQNHVYSMYWLGRLLSDGEPDPPDDIARANGLLLAAANAGSADAQNSIGIHYHFGVGFSQNYALASEWYSKAAAQGHSWGQMNLGILAGRGLGRPTDHAAAAQWYEKAVAQDNPSAKWRLAYLLADGTGVRQDPARAMALFEQAASAGEADGWNGMGYLHLNGIGVPKDSSMAFGHYRRSAQAGNVTGMYRAATLLEERNPRRAFELRLKAAELGHADAQNNTGSAYETGYGVEINTASALYWYAKSAQQGGARAKQNIANLLPRRSYVTIGANRANLRAEPSTTSRVLDSLSKGTRVYPIDSPVPGWREVFVESGSQLGYLSSSVLEAQAPPRASTPVASSDGWPAPPEPRPGYVTCNTNCRNGDCRRTYSDGRRVRFQARQQWNPLSNQFEWDSGGC